MVYESTTNVLDDQNRTVENSSDIICTVHLERNYVLIYNSAKTKSSSFHYQRLDPKSSPAVINVCTLIEARCLESLLEIHHTTYLK